MVIDQSKHMRKSGTPIPHSQRDNRARPHPKLRHTGRSTKYNKAEKSCHSGGVCRGISLASSKENNEYCCCFHDSKSEAEKGEEGAYGRSICLQGT